MVHTSLAIVCSCLPVLMPLVPMIAKLMRVPGQKYLYSWYSASRSWVRGTTGREKQDSDMDGLGSRGEGDVQLLSRQVTTDDYTGYVSATRLEAS